MNFDKLFTDSPYLDNQISFFTTKKQIVHIEKNNELVQAHLKKARHNASFYQLNKSKIDYADWLIVILYYSLYHAALSLIVHKGFNSKNHHATIIILIKEYNISYDEATLIDQLAITKEDAQLYTSLKQDRHDASYSTSSRFTQQQIKLYEDRVLDFINKAQDIVSQ